MSEFEAVTRARVARILIDSRLTERQRWIGVWNFVLTHELEVGTKFLHVIPNGQLYVILGHDNRILPLPRRGGDPWHSYFQNTYGFGEREKLAKFIYDALRAYTHDSGARVELRRFAAYSATSRSAYLSTYDGRMYRVEGTDSISTIQLGEDGIFFADDDGGIPLADQQKPEIGNHGILFDRLCSPNFVDKTPGGILPEQQRKALIVWLLALAFPDLAPTKPILVLEGVKGSGKTTSITLIQQVLMGTKRPMILQKNKEDDFGVVLLKAGPIALFDNQDKYVDWLADAICAYATAGVWTKRKLYEDDASITIKPHSFIAVSTRNPSSYRRDDVADRCIILRLDRRDEFTSTALLEQELLAERPKLLGEYLWWVGRIVETLREGAQDDAQDEEHRMADFAMFARVVGHVMDWGSAEIDDLLNALQSERDAFLNEEDPLIDVLYAWIKSRNGGPGNVGRLVPLIDLNMELESYASIKGLQWRETTKSLANKLVSSHIRHDFIVERSMPNGRKAFRIWRKTDAKLSVVPAESAKSSEPELKIND